MTGSRPGQGGTRIEDPPTTDEASEPETMSAEGLFGAAQEEIAQQFRSKIAHVPRHRSRDERAAAIWALMVEMLLCRRPLSNVHAKHRQRSSSRRPFKFRQMASHHYKHLQIGVA